MSGDDAWVPVPDRLMVGVADEIRHIFSPPTGDTSEVPATLIEALIEYLGEDIECDHEVGICACGTRQLVEELGLALRREALCPDCAGDGFDWDQDTYDRAATEARALGYEPSDADGYVPCPTCTGSGRVSTDDAVVPPAGGGKEVRERTAAEEM